MVLLGVRVLATPEVVSQFMHHREDYSPLFSHAGIEVVEPLVQF
jgi:hypothetical protein